MFSANAKITLNTINKMTTIAEAQVNIMRRIRENKPGIVTAHGTQEFWKNLEIPYYLRTEEPFWNLSTNDETCRVIYVSPSKNIQYQPSICLGDNVESKDGWIVGTITKYSS